MALTPKITKSIADFVRVEPKTIQEISKYIGKSWVTTDSYVNKIQENTGLVRVKVFRQGTRGAIKVVFWNYEDSLMGDDLKAELFNKIRVMRKKTDFDPLEIFQHVPKKQRRSFIEEYTDPNISTKQNIVEFLSKTENELLCFSGNLSWINIREGNKVLLSVIEELLKRKVSVKILCRIDLASTRNITKIAGLVKKYGNLVSIRHCFHPLRGFIVDDNVARLKDVKEKAQYKDGEVKSNFRVFYDMYNPEWVDWLQKVFWNLYRSAYDYEQRLSVLEEIF